MAQLSCAINVKTRSVFASFSKEGAYDGHTELGGRGWDIGVLAKVARSHRVRRAATVATLPVYPSAGCDADALE